MTACLQTVPCSGKH